MHTKPPLDRWSKILNQNSKSDATFTEPSGVAWHRPADKWADTPTIGTNHHVGVSYTSQISLTCLTYYRGIIAALYGIPGLFAASEKFYERDGNVYRRKGKGSLLNARLLAFSKVHNTCLKQHLPKRPGLISIKGRFGPAPAVVMSVLMPSVELGYSLEAML